MLIHTMIKQLLAGDPITNKISQLTDRSTKLRLERARLRRRQPAVVMHDARHDNSLRGEIQLRFSLQRMKHANMIGCCYWTQGKESLRDLLSAQPETEAESGPQPCATLSVQEAEPESRSDFTRLALGIELDFLASFLPESKKNRVVGDYVLRNKGDEVVYRTVVETNFPADELIAGIRRLGVA